MQKHIMIATSWVTALSALISMIIGHTGAHDLRWQINQISTYAATAPHDAWITAAMVLPCIALTCLSILISRHKMLGDNQLAHIVPLLAGASVSGLLMLAAFEETAPTIKALKISGFEAIRQQSFHDAGLLIFFYGTIVVAVVLGVLIIAEAIDWKEKIIGAATSLLGLASFPLMTTAWPRLAGIVDSGPGLKQRASLLSLWLAIMLALSVISRRHSVMAGIFSEEERT